jgi:hypothetical protein
MHMKCNVCKGQKTVKGLGSIEHKCNECKGIGYTEASKESIVHAVNDEAPRRGRPAKDKVL